jgi:hypothetical protein
MQAQWPNALGPTEQNNTSLCRSVSMPPHMPFAHSAKDRFGYQADTSQI